jgi:hypothetical protein
MSTANLEERVADLEDRYAELLKLVQARPKAAGWQSVVGLFADDPHIADLHDETRRIRNEDRAATGGANP